VVIEAGLTTSFIISHISDLSIYPTDMSQVTLRPQPSALPRRNSLFLPDIRETTTSLIRPNSYSPFPALPGTNADPHNLDRFLLSPDDPAWLYHFAAASDTAVLRQAIIERGKDAPMPSGRPLKKVRSFSMLNQTSPLSRPPINAEDESEHKEVRQRKRSNSMDSTSSPRNESQESLDFTPELISEVKKGSGGRKSLRQALYFRKRQASQTPESAESSSGSASPPRSRNADTSPSSASSVEESDPTTPLSTRSNSDHSEKSSLSSASSSEGVMTPSEAAAHQLAIDIAAGKLAVALAAAGEKQRRKGNWKEWLSGRRASKVSSAPGSGASTPSDTSSEPPAQAVSDTVVDPPQATAPSPKPASPAPAATSLAERSIDRALTIEQLRRISLRKLGQLRAPSPHPLALSLKRQYSNLPEEVAYSIQSGQKVFPMSVNAHDPTSGLNPMQGGLVTALGVKSVLTKLERGEGPEGQMMSRRLSDPMTVPRPRGVLDFVDRPPFEERNIVFFPNGTLSPISMARPGYGVWDLDFSPYILALSTVDCPPANSWSSLSRTNLGLIDGVESKATTAAVPTTSPDSEAEDVLVSPVPLTISLDDDLVGPPKASKSASDVAKAPVSSFRNFKRPAVTTAWDVSSEEDDDEEEDENDDEDDDDNSPLATIFSKRTSSSSALAPPRPVILKHERSKSTPTAKRVSLSFLEDEEKKRRNLDEVARARERRQANLAGETERRAEAEKHHRRSLAAPPSSYRRSSTLEVSHRRSSGDVTPPVQSATSTPPLSPPSPPKANRRRTQSSYDMQAPKLGTARTTSAPEGGLQSSKRYHSFYEAPKVPSPQLPPPAHLSRHSFHMAPTYPTPYGYPHPAMHAYPTLSPSASMMFPAPGYLQPMMTHPHQSLSHSYSSAQINVAMYHQMQHQASRSSLQLPTTRPGASHRPHSTFASTINLNSRSPRPSNHN
jgi:hypothetical protein